MELPNLQSVTQVVQNVPQLHHQHAISATMDIAYLQTQSVLPVTPNVKLVESLQQHVLLVMQMHSSLPHHLVYNVIALPIAKSAYKPIPPNVSLVLINT